MNRKHTPKRMDRGLSRREFLAAATAAGAGLAIGRKAFAIGAGSKTDDLNVAVIGVGTQGQVLLFTNCVKMAGLRFRAVCDIWPKNRDYIARALKAYRHDVKAYTDYRDMLAEQKDLDAVIIATPDSFHAEHTIACLKAGLHVYCEKEMSNSVEQARQMVIAARETGKLLQIGHQRRSNPRYLVALEYLRDKKALGRTTFVSGHWNRQKILTRGWPAGSDIGAADLAKYGYDTMERFMNWRWYKKFSGGAIADLGSHQIDVFHWFLGALPTAVMASGGLDYYTGIEWYDNVNALYEWPYAWGGETKPVRGFYQTLGTTSHGGYTETFMGTEGSLIISEFEGIGGLRRETTAPVADWEQPLLDAKKAEEDEAARKAEEEARKAAEAATEKSDLVLAQHSVPMPGRYYPPIAGMKKPVHMPHLENFFDAVRGKARLTCPAEVGFETCVSVLRVNEAVEAGRRLNFKPEEFKA